MNRLTSPRRGPRELDQDLFDLITDNMGYANDATRAKAMGVHPSLLSKIRSGRVRPGRKFIEGLVGQLGIAYETVFVPRKGA